MYLGLFEIHEKEVTEYRKLLRLHLIVPKQVLAESPISSLISIDYHLVRQKKEPEDKVQPARALIPIRI